MSISSAFLAGQQVRNQADAQKLGLLNVLIQRPMARRGGAIRYGGGGGRRDEIESFEDSESRQAVEDRESKKQTMLEEAHGADMDRKDLEFEILEQAKSEKEQATRWKAQDEIIATAEGFKPAQLRNAAQDDALAYQDQMRHYKAYSDAIYRGDATAADRHFRGMYPGMGANSRTSVTRQKQPLRDAVGNPVLDDQGNPALGEMTQNYDAEGNPITEEVLEKKGMGYPKHRSDGGVVSLQFGDEPSMPIGSKILRQMHMSIHPSMMQSSGGGGGGGTAGPATGVKVTAKDQSTILKNNIANGAKINEAALKYAENIPVELAEGEEHDPLNPKPKSAQQFGKNYLEGVAAVLKLAETGGKSNKYANQLGFTGKNYLTGQAAKVAVGRVRDMFDDQKGKKPDLRMIMERGKQQYGPNFYKEMNRNFLPELTPGELDFKYDNPKEIPSFGHGADNVMHIFDKDIGKDGLYFAIDKTLKRPMRYDHNKKAWTAMSSGELTAYAGMLETQSRGGDEQAREVLQALNEERMTPYSEADLSKRIGDTELRARSAISDATQGVEIGRGPVPQTTPEEMSEAMSDRSSPASRFLKKQRDMPQEEKEEVLARKERRDKGSFLRRRPYAAGQ